MFTYVTSCPSHNSVRQTGSGGRRGLREVKRPPEATVQASGHSAMTFRDARAPSMPLSLVFHHFPAVRHSPLHKVAENRKLKIAYSSAVRPISEGWFRERSQRA